MAFKFRDLFQVEVPIMTLEFIYVLADKQVKVGQDIVLSCETNCEKNGITVTWNKNGVKLQYVQGKHKISQNGRTHILEIKNAQHGDEGNYEITVGGWGNASCAAMVTIELNEWRSVEWKQDPMIEALRKIKLESDGVKELRFLLHGPVGAGKSSIVNTIKSIFEGYQFINCLAASDTSGTSFTLKYQKFTVGNQQSGLLPFAFYDLMGLEEEQQKGAHTDDIIKALKGHIPDNYEFQETHSMSKDNRYYIDDPTLDNKIHCLVSVIPADKISLMDEKVITKMKEIRAEASKLGIPQVLFMTKVDKACTLTQQDVGNIYKSKKVKEKMQECSNRLGITMNCIFPLKSYHEETKPNENLNCLMLEALKQIVFSARDYVKKCPDKQKSVE